jgi:hypothetical protein
VFAQGEEDLAKYAQTTFANDSKLVSEITKRYPVGKEGYASGFDAIAQVITEFQFQCVSLFQRTVNTTS